jgi:putative ABC transport system permease protein
MLVAWRMLSDEKGRSALAVGGISIALLLVFLQLGFYLAVPRGGMLIYDTMAFDIVLTSPDYAFQGLSGSLARRRLYQAQALPEVKQAIPLYQQTGEWMTASTGVARDVFVMAFDPAFKIFNVDEITARQDALRRPDTILVDTATRKEFGELSKGRVVEIERRAETIIGTYRLGTGFAGLGIAITSDQNFLRLFPARKPGEVSLGLLRLKAGADPRAAAQKLRDMLPADVQVMTRAELAAYEKRHWTQETSTGLIFGFGAVVAFIVGMAIINQILSTQLLRQLPQYATLKAIGYTEGALLWIVVSLAVLMAMIGFVPSLALATIINVVLRHVTLLPLDMTPGLVFTVLMLALAMSCISALASARVLRRADPVELF